MYESFNKSIGTSIMRGRDQDGTYQIYQTLLKSNKEKPQKELRTTITSLRDAITDLENLLPSLEDPLISLIEKENDEVLLNQMLHHCKKDITQQLKDIARGRAHPFLTDWKRHNQEADAHETIYLGKKEDVSHYQRFKKLFQQPDCSPLDSFLKLYNTIALRLTVINKLKLDEELSHSTPTTYRHGY